MSANLAGLFVLLLVVFLASFLGGWLGGRSARPTRPANRHER